MGWGGDVVWWWQVEVEVEAATVGLVVAAVAVVAAAGRRRWGRGPLSPDLETTSKAVGATCTDAARRASAPVRVATAA